MAGHGAVHRRRAWSAMGAVDPTTRDLRLQRQRLRRRHRRAPPAARSARRDRLRGLPVRAALRDRASSASAARPARTPQEQSDGDVLLRGAALRRHGVRDARPSTSDGRDALRAGQRPTSPTASARTTTAPSPVRAWSARRLRSATRAIRSAAAWRTTAAGSAARAVRSATGHRRVRDRSLRRRDLRRRPGLPRRRLRGRAARTSTCATGEVCEAGTCVDDPAPA